MIKKEVAYKNRYATILLIIFLILVIKRIFMRRAFLRSIRDSYLFLSVRPTNNFYCLDGIRAFSILWVIAAHVGLHGVINRVDDGGRLLIDAAPPVLGWIYNGAYGVDVFFVLSGFLIARLIFIEIDKYDTVNLPRFYLRRFMRLSPALLLLALASYVTGLYYQGNLWYNILYISNFFPILDVSLAWTWSLSVEEQFYLIFPLTALLVKKHRLLVFFILFAVAISIRYFVLVQNSSLLIQPNGWLPPTPATEEYFLDLYLGLHTRFGALVCGIIAFLIYGYHKDNAEKFFKSASGVILLIFSLAGFLFIVFTNLNKKIVILSEFQLYFYHVLWGYSFSFFTAVIMLSTLLNSPLLSYLRRFLSLKIWYPIAQLTYSLYLFHFFALTFARYLFGGILAFIGEEFDMYNHIHMFSIFALTLIVSLIIAGIVYIFVERPCMSLRDKFSISTSSNSLANDIQSKVRAM